MANEGQPDQAQDAVDAVLDELGQRKGFRWWWDDVDQEIRDQIRSAAADRVRELSS